VTATIKTRAACHRCVATAKTGARTSNDMHGTAHTPCAGGDYSFATWNPELGSCPGNQRRCGTTGRCGPRCTRHQRERTTHGSRRVATVHEDRACSIAGIVESSAGDQFNVTACIKPV